MSGHANCRTVYEVNHITSEWDRWVGGSLFFPLFLVKCSTSCNGNNSPCPPAGRYQWRYTDLYCLKLWLPVITHIYFSPFWHQLPSWPKPLRWLQSSLAHHSSVIQGELHITAVHGAMAPVGLPGTAGLQINNSRTDIYLPAMFFNNLS